MEMPERRSVAGAPAVLFVRAALAALLVSGCSGDGLMPPGDQPVPDECAALTVLSQEAFLPSVVRISFQLSRCDGEPLPGKTPADFLITEDGTEVSRFESSQDFVTDERCFVLLTVLVLDMSGSILESGSLPDLQAAAIGFVETVIEEQTIAVYTFDGRARMQLVTPFTDDVDALRAGIASLSEHEPVDRSTNLNGAVLEGLDTIDAELDSIGSVDITGGSLVIFTDGTDQAARVPDETAVFAATESEHRVYTIGLGGEIDRDALTQIGKDGSFISDDVETLQQVFQAASSAIRSTAQSYYILAYCSPKRSGTHRLELSLRGLTGSVTYDFSASGFEGGCTPDDFIGEVGCGAGE